MAICSNNFYMIFAADEFFNDTYVQSDTNIVNDIEFAVYTGQNNGATILVKNSTSPGSIAHWRVEAARNYGQGNGLGGYVWFSAVGAEACPINFSSTNFTIGSTPVGVFIVTPESLRSTRQKLYVHSTAEYEGAIWSGEYTLQPDAYNNFSWWKNEATQAVIVYGPVNYSGWGFVVSYYIFKNKAEADLYFAGSTSNIFFVQSTNYEVKDVITPFEFNGADLSGATEGQRGNTIISYKPFQSPLPENEDYNALVSFFGRDGVSFDFNDLDKYGLYTFKGDYSFWRGVFYRWDVDLNINLPGNSLFLEWIKSLQRGVDYKINGKKILLNKKSEKLKSIQAIKLNYYGNLATLKTLNTQSFSDVDVDLSSVSIDNIKIGKVKSLIIHQANPLTQPNISVNIQGPITNRFDISNNGSSIIDLNIDENALKDAQSIIIDQSALDGLSNNSLVQLYEAYKKNNIASDSDLDNPSNLSRLLNIDSNLFNDVVAAIAVKAANSSGGSGSGSGDAGIAVTYLNYIFEEADKIIWNWFDKDANANPRPATPVAIANFYLKTIIGRPILASEISFISSSIGNSNCQLILNDTLVTSSGSSTILHPESFTFDSYTTSTSLLRPGGINPSVFLKVVRPSSMNFSCVALVQDIDTGTKQLFYYGAAVNGQQVKQGDRTYSRTPINITSRQEFCYEVYDDGKVWEVNTFLASANEIIPVTRSDLENWTELGHSPTSLRNDGGIDYYAFKLICTDVYEGKFYVSGGTIKIAVISSNEGDFIKIIRQPYNDNLLTIPQQLFTKDDIKDAGMIRDYGNNGTLLVLLENGDLYGYHFVFNDAYWKKLASNILSIAYPVYSDFYYILDGKDNEIKMVGTGNNDIANITYNELPAFPSQAGQKYSQIDGVFGIRIFE